MLMRKARCPKWAEADLDYRCRIYLPGLWQLSVIPSFSGYCLRNVIFSFLLFTCAALAILTLIDSLDTSRLPRDDGSPSSPPSIHSSVIPVATDTKNSVLNYGVMIDCGSSGSRVFVYFWPPHQGDPNKLLDIKPMHDMAAQTVVMKIEPGIASYANTPQSASEYLKPLLEYAAGHIPRAKHKETPLYIMATAGMRMLTEQQQTAILDDLRQDVTKDFDFLFSDTQVEVISGKQEGVYAWVAINLALGKFDHSLGDDPLTVVDLPGSEGKTHIRKRTVGIMDMGGGSLQIAFEVPQSVRFEKAKEDIAKSMLAEFNLGCSRDDADHQYRVYVATFLGFGANTVRKEYEKLLVTNLTNTSNTSNSSMAGLAAEYPLSDPCLNLNNREQILSSPQTVHLRGTGEFEACQSVLRPLLNKSVPCIKQPCSLNGAYQPEISKRNSEFYGFAEFYYTMEDILRKGGRYEYDTFHTAAKEYCKIDWTTVESWKEKGLHLRADANRYRLQCFKSAWLSLILHEGLEFPQSYKSLTSLQYINGNEVHWTLGALLYKTRFYPLREIERHTSKSYKPPWMVEELSRAYSLLILCIVIVALSICIYLRRLRLVPSQRLTRVPTMSYFMTEEDQMEDGLLINRDAYFKPMDY